MIKQKSKPNPFFTKQVQLYEVQDDDPIDLSSGSLQIIKPPKKKGKYLRQIYGLDGSKFIEVPRHETLDRFYEFGILPNCKYSFDVILEIASLIKDEDGERSPDEIVKILRNKYPAMEKARISRYFVKKALEISTAVLLPMLPELANLPKKWTLMIDSTLRVGGESMLVVILAITHDYTFPLLASFLPSENFQDLFRLLTELKQRLPHQPQAVISDFSKGFLSAIPEVFPKSIHLGCHFHALEIFARMLLNPYTKPLRKIIVPLLKNLKNWAKGVLHITSLDGSQDNQDNQDNFELRSFARCITFLQEKGKFGQKLLDASMLLLAIIGGIKDSQQLTGVHPSQIKLLKKIIKKVMKSDELEIKKAISQLRVAIQQFQMIRDALSPQSDPHRLLQLAEKWRMDKDTKLVKVAEKIEELAPYLLPAIRNDQLPRTTSILESLHGSVKQTIRKWRTSTPTSTFNWIAPLLSVLDRLDEIGWKKIYKQLPLISWYNKVIE